MRKARTGKVSSFSALSWEMLNSQAYIRLPHSAAKALPYFIGKVKTRLDDPERYKTELELSYREAQRYGFAPGTFSKVIQALIAHGMLDPVDKGGLRGAGKSTNKFTLSLRWKNYGNPDFEPLNWKCFCPKPRLRVTSKKETYNFIKGNKIGIEGHHISRIEAVEVISA